MVTKKKTSAVALGTHRDPTKSSNRTYSKPSRFPNNLTALARLNTRICVNTQHRPCCKTFSRMPKRLRSLVEKFVSPCKQSSVEPLHPKVPRILGPGSHRAVVQAANWGAEDRLPMGGGGLGYRERGFRGQGLGVQRAER